jgi:hypothetical protein
VSNHLCQPQGGKCSPFSNNRRFQSRGAPARDSFLQRLTDVRHAHTDGSVVVALTRVNAHGTNTGIILARRTTPELFRSVQRVYNTVPFCTGIVAEQLNSLEVSAPTV